MELGLRCAASCDEVARYEAGPYNCDRSFASHMAWEPDHPSGIESQSPTTVESRRWYEALRRIRVHTKHYDNLTMS